MDPVAVSLPLVCLSRPVDSCQDEPCPAMRYEPDTLASVAAIGFLRHVLRGVSVGVVLFRRVVSQGTRFSRMFVNCAVPSIDVLARLSKHATLAE